MTSGKKCHILITHVSYGGGVPSGEDVSFAKDVKFFKNHDDYRLSVLEVKKSTSTSIIKKFAMNFISYIFANLSLLRICFIEPPKQIIVHNTFPYFSLLLLKIIANFIRVTMYMHNHRFYCVNATLMRENKICTLCVSKKNNFQGIRFRCKNNSRILSAVYSLYGTLWRNVRLGKIDLITFSDRHREIVLTANFATDEMIRVIPHFVHNQDLSSSRHHGPEDTLNGPRSFAYFGRLSPEKGICELLSKYRHGVQNKFDIYGSGVDLQEVQKLTQMHQLNTNIFAPQSNVETIELMKTYHYIIFPSTCFETFGLVIAEAFSVGTPVLIYNVGSPADYVVDGYNGFIMDPSDPWLNIKHALSLPKAQYSLLRKNARQTFEANFSVKNRLNLTK